VLRSRGKWQVIIERTKELLVTEGTSHSSKKIESVLGDWSR
jgi:hypothetical protein